MTEMPLVHWRPPRSLVLVWGGLLVLLGLTVLCAYQPWGGLNTPIALAIASCKALLVALVFMELRHSSALTVVFACAGFFWLGILLWLAFGDYLTREVLPPAIT
jgi:cytochrome c oxidase subunit 4